MTSWDDSQKENGASCSTSLLGRETSMASLIIWNISKVIERSPNIDLRSAIKGTQERLEHNSHDVNTIIAQYPERHLACALLAWQELGHNNPDSLYRFIESRKNDECASSEKPHKSEDNIWSPKLADITSDPNDCAGCKGPERSKEFNFGSYQVGPVIKLPVETKIVMRLDANNTPSAQETSRKKPKAREKDILDKINEACCLESECVERLTALGTATAELRSRATKLARREAERVQLLERAETAWKDLELGYQRRLTFAQEKEDDLMRQTQKLIEERNGYKGVCVTLAKKLKERGDAAEAERLRLTQVERDVCERACARVHLMEQSAREDSTLADHQCRAAQLDRDLQFKEEQARRKLLSGESEVESLRALSFEAERAMRAELSALRDQMSQVSKQLLAEDEENIRITTKLEELRTEKAEIVEDLDGCKVMCDNRMQAKMDELKKKQEQLTQLEEQVLECRCKLPVDVTVEVKRTPSLAALCRCTPEDKELESCSCTSIRSRLLSTMLADLFGGLQVELGSVGSDMPCQLLKCLEDRHNWDRSSITKSNLRKFFSKLLMGELDIAIATSIEKYHAKWVGESCADTMKLVPNPNESETEMWQQRGIERKAMKLAEHIAEKMFQEKAEELAKRAKKIAASSGPPPCECKPDKTGESATFRCHVDQTPWRSILPASTSAASPGQWRRTSRDVTLLRTEIQNLKRESIKKKDLKLMEKEIAKVVQLAQNPSDEISNESSKDLNTETNKKDKRAGSIDTGSKYHTNKANHNKKTSFDVTKYSKNVNRAPIIRTNKGYKKQSYAVNMCVCTVNDPKRLKLRGKPMQIMANEENLTPLKQHSSTDVTHQMSSINPTHPVAKFTPDNNLTYNESAPPNCNNDGGCFHKLPSNTSIDQLLNTLVKWNCDLCTTQVRQSQVSKPVSVKTGDLDNNIEDTNKNKIQFNSNILRQDTKSKSSSNKKVVSQKSNNETVILYNLSDKNITEVTEFKHSLPTATNSEYMGAINLDKSYENVCKCATDVNEDDSDVPLNCIGSCNCPLKSLDVIEKPKIEIFGGNVNHALSNQQHNVQGSTRISNTKTTSKNSNNEDNKITSIRMNIIDISKKKSVKLDTNDMQNKMSKEQNTDPIMNPANPILNPAQNCEYQIEFLGVTLTNANINTNFTDYKKSNNIPSEENHPTPIEYNESNTKLNNNCTYNPQLQTNQINNNGSSSLPRCKDDVQCNFKDTYFNKRYVDCNMNEDKFIDIQSLKGSTLGEQESCVCCLNNLIEESNDLEVNTYHLLQQHLKEKLDHFKNRCTSSCIPRDEENKLFSSLLQKIKQVIADSASEVVCKCSEECPTEGSWNRAFNLLQEYLKTKINRVQCMCDSPKEMNTTILPDVTDKVFSLIEHDFQRLKDICKCRNVQKSAQKVISMELFQVPERDTTLSFNNDIHKEPIVTTKSDGICKQLSNTSIIVTETISSQVPPNLAMETKSCDAMERNNKLMQTVRIDNIVPFECVFTESKSCDCRSVFTTGVASKDHCLDLLGTKNTPVLQQDFSEERNIMEKHASNVDSNTKVASPYIGYTVDCSCDNNLGNCVCTKSLVEENSSKIKSIWNTFTTKPYSSNLSYIMDSVDKKKDMHVVHITEDPYFFNKVENLTSLTNSLCNPNTNKYNELDVKDSKEYTNVTPQDTTTNTCDDDMMSLDADYNTVDPLEWFECGSQPLEAQRLMKYKSVHFPIENLKRTSEVFAANHALHLRRSLSRECDCNMVPICHVKMLIENIENKLACSECICDSLCSKVCPVHSKK